MSDNMIEVKNVTMKFRMSDEPINSLKEIFTTAVSGKLKFNEFLALDDVSFELEKGKTLDGAFAEMRKWARKHQRGGACCVSPAQALEIVLGYYGLDAGGPIPQAHPPKAQALAPDPLGDGLDLDALLNA